MVNYVTVPTSLNERDSAALLELLVELQAKRGMSYLLISHDLEVIAAMSHRIAVMQAVSELIAMRDRNVTR